MLNKKIKHREKIIKRQNKLKGLHQRTRLYQLFYNHLEKYAFVLGIFLALLYIFLIKFVVNKQSLSLIIIIMNTMIFIAFGFWTKSLVDYTKIDHFTNLYNRNFFSLKTKDYLDQIDANKPLTMLVMDIDQFKKINDDFGHLAGDQALLLFAEILNDNFDNKDLVARWGGDEFVVVLRNTTEVEALIKAKTISNKINTCTRNKTNFTISVGIVTTSKNVSLDNYFEKGDQALYAAKNHKNKIVTYSSIVEGRD